MDKKKDKAHSSPEDCGKQAGDQSCSCANDHKEKNYEELWDRHLRLQADFDNYRKRSFKERVELIKYANEGLIMELLSILDNFALGVKAAEQKHDFALLHQGVDMISKQLHALLEAKGLKRIKALGEKFDPHLHEPLDVVEGDDSEEDVVCEEMQPGYLLNDRIIRPAKVKVKKGKHSFISKENEQAEPQQGEKAEIADNSAEDNENEQIGES